MKLFTTADIAKATDLEFPNDPRSQRARVASERALVTNAKSKGLPYETLVQIVSLENISKSKRDQLDELLVMYDIESVGADRHRFAGQTIVRNVDVEGEQQNNDNSPNANGVSTNGQSGLNNLNQFYKLTVQDTSGNLLYALELEKLPFLSSKNLKSGFPIQLGSKLLIKKDCELEEGVLLLTRSSVDFLGGLVPEWNQKISERHIELLKEQLEKKD